MYKKYILAVLAITALTVFGGSVHARAEEGADSQTPPPPRPGLFEMRERAQNTKDVLERRDGEVRKNFFENHEGGERPPFAGRPNGMGSTTQGEMRERFEQVREHFFERREHFASTTALRKGQFSEEMRTRILEHADHIASLGNAMVGRLTMILERLTARIESLKAEGVDTTSAEALLADAQDAVADAESAMQEVETAMQSALESETPRDEVESSVKPLKDSAKTALRAAYEALKAVAQALPRPAVSPEEDTNS